MRSKFVFGLLVFALIRCRADAASQVEQQVADAVKNQGISIVHLWAPWCSNCQHELKSGGWTKMVKENPNVKFYFVSVWDNGDDGRAMLAKYDLAQPPNVTILADPGPRGAGHIQQFLGNRLNWIPSTWVFRAGTLLYALNYGEIHFPMLQQLIADGSSEW